MVKRMAFFSWLAVTIATFIGLFFAGHFGLLSSIWHKDLSYMSSVIGALVICTIAYLGCLSWMVPDKWFHGHHEICRLLEDQANWGLVAADISPALGLCGTIFGLSQQAAALREGGDVLGMLGTSLFSTLAGVAGFAIIILQTHLLESSLRRARRNAA